MPPGTILSTPWQTEELKQTQTNAADQEESEPVSLSSCNVSFSKGWASQRQPENTHWWAWQTRRARLSLNERKKDISVSAEPLSVDFLPQWCPNCHSTQVSLHAHSQDLPCSVLRSWCSRSCYPLKQDELGWPFPPLQWQIWWNPHPQPPRENQCFSVVPSTSNFFQIYLEIVCTWACLQVGQRGSWMAMEAFKHLPDETEGYNDKPPGIQDTVWNCGTTRSWGPSESEEWTNCLQWFSLYD